MGASCSSDKYIQLRHKYHMQLSKLIISQKNKQFLDRILQKLQSQIKEESARCQTNAQAYRIQKQQQMQNYYIRVKDELDKRQPGGIYSLQQMTNSKVQNLLGVDLIRNMFRQLENNIEQEYGEQQRQMVEQLNEIKKAQDNILETPGDQFLNQWADENQKKDIIKRGELQFHQNIMEYQQYVLGQYQQQLKTTFYSDRFQHIQSQTAVDQLLAISKQKLITSLNIILSQKLDQYIFLK